MFSNKEIFGVVEILIQTILDGVNDSGLQIDQKCARDVVLVIRLIEKNILAIVTQSCILFQDTFRVDSMLLA